MSGLLPFSPAIINDLRYTPNASGGLSTKNWTVCSSMTHFNESTNLSNGTSLGSRTGWQMTPEISGNGLVITYGNIGANISATPANYWQEYPTPNDIIVEWGVWSGVPGTSNFFPGTFNGQLKFTMQSGNGVVYQSDPLNIPVVAGTPIYGDLRVTVTAGNKFHYAGSNLLGATSAFKTAYDNGTVDGVTSPSALGATTNSNSVAWPASVGVGRIVWPFSFKTHTAGTNKVCLIRGDSIAAGLHDMASTLNITAYQYAGHLTKSVKALGVLAARLTLSSDLAQYNQPGMQVYRGAQWDGVTHSIWEYGTNDIGTGTAIATIQGYATAVATQDTLTGIIPIISTLTPRTDANTPSDLWSSIANQTLSTHTSNILNYNTWVRNLPSPFRSFIDPYTVVADAATGKWGVGTVTTGITVSANTSPTTTVFSLTGYSATTSGLIQDYVATCTAATNGTNVGVSRQITAFSGGNGTCTTAAWPASVTIGDTFTLTQVYTNDGLHPNEWGTALIIASSYMPANTFSSLI